MKLAKEYLTRPRNLDPSLHMVLSAVTQVERRSLIMDYTTNGDLAEFARVPLTFDGDVPPDGPPFGWVCLWAGKCANIYNEYVPESVSQSGYVFWNQSRWPESVEDDFRSIWQSESDLADIIWEDFAWSPLVLL